MNFTPKYIKPKNGTSKTYQEHCNHTVHISIKHYCSYDKLQKHVKITCNCNDNVINLSTYQMIEKSLAPSLSNVLSL